MPDQDHRVPAHLREEVEELLPMARASLATVQELVARFEALWAEWNTTLHPSLAEPDSPDGDIDGDLLIAWTVELNTLLYAIGNLTHAGQSSPAAKAYAHSGITGSIAEDPCHWRNFLRDFAKSEGAENLLQVMRKSDR